MFEFAVANVLNRKSLCSEFTLYFKWSACQRDMRSHSHFEVTVLQFEQYVMIMILKCICSAAQLQPAYKLQGAAPQGCTLSRLTSAPENILLEIC